jgi:hypothetical protein
MGGTPPQTPNESKAADRIYEHAWPWGVAFILWFITNTDLRLEAMKTIYKEGSDVTWSRLLMALTMVVGALMIGPLIGVIGGVFTTWLMDWLNNKDYNKAQKVFVWLVAIIVVFGLSYMMLGV